MTVHKDNQGVSISRYFPFGTHRIIWQVRDICGNLSECEEIITIEDASLPTVAVTDRVFNLSASGEIMIRASDFISDAGHPCKDSLLITMSRKEESFISSEAQSLYSCSDVGAHHMTIYVSYPISGNQSVVVSADATMIIQDAASVCPNNSGNEGQINGIVNGRVITEDGVALPGVTIDLVDEKSTKILKSVRSDNIGLYSLGPIRAEDLFFIEPSLTGDHLTGLSTLDIVYIQRHLLGMELLETSAQYIAADVNRDKKISVSDILDIRRALLSLPSQLEAKRVWEFINARRRFEDPVNTLQEENASVFPVTYDSCYNELLAIKMGDINRSLLFEKSKEASGRSLVKAVLSDRELKKGEEGMAQISFQKNIRAYGFQLALEINEQQLEITDIKHPLFELEYNQSESGIVLISASRGHMVSLDRDNSQLHLHFVVKQDGQLKNALRLNKSFLEPELYTDGMETKEITLSFMRPHEPVESMEVYPNPVKDQFFLEVSSLIMDTGDLQIYDGVGRFHYQQTITISSGENLIEVQRPEHLLPGVYYLVLSFGDKRFSRKLILI